MLIKNIYYILEINKENFIPTVNTMTEKEKNLFVENTNTVRWNNDNTKCVVKLKLGIKAPPKIIEHLIGFSHEQILKEMSKPEWESDII